MKGIILAGGAGTRLRPLTTVTSKQLLPVYDRPMIYYPLQTLVKAGIREVLVIVAPDHAGDYLHVLGSGKEFGIRITYEIQEKPEGLAQAFLIGESFVGDEPVTLILGDNLFLDDQAVINEAMQSFSSGAHLFVTKVENPKRYGVVEFDEHMVVKSIVEKPEHPKSNHIATGLYIYDGTVVSRAKKLMPSARNELEITDLNNSYLASRELKVSIINGVYLDTGTFDSLLQANNIVASRKRSGSA